uniref:MHD domain-containing protein n=1 Tax=Leptocylindrus danicus TaxID=163516 RepID=A0A7S2L704_9STRA
MANGSVQTPEPDNSSSSSPSSPVRILASLRRNNQLRLPPSPSASSISHASSGTLRSKEESLSANGSAALSDSANANASLSKQIELVSAKVQSTYIQSSGPKQSSSVVSDIHSSSSTSNRADGNAIPTSIPPRPKQVVNIGLNEDLSCSYRASKLSSMAIEGIVQIQVKSPREEGYPFIVRVKDSAHQIKSILENKIYAEPLDEPHKKDVRSYNVSIPPKETFVSVFKYKCNSDLRPVPIRVQTRVRMVGDSCRVALQISSNPSNVTHLTDLNIFMEVPPVVKGETLVTSPAGGVWNENQRHVLWCVSRLASGEKFQLQAQFDLISQEEEGTIGEEREKPHFPVFARCNGTSEQLSNVEITIAEAKSSSISLAMRAARRFRVSHREQSV